MVKDRDVHVDIAPTPVAWHPDWAAFLIPVLIDNPDMVSPAAPTAQPTHNAQWVGSNPKAKHAACHIWVRCRQGEQ